MAVVMKHPHSFLPALLMLLLAACAPLPDATPAQGSAAAVKSVAAEDPTLHPFAGSTWILASLNGRPPLPSTHLTITFTQSEVSGFGGCNRFGGNYAVEGNYVRPDTVQRTLEGCLGEGILEQERAYVNAVQVGGQFRLKGDRLEILDQDGQIKLAFTRQAEWPPQEEAALLGNTWQLMAVNGTRPLSGSTITLAFVAQGKNEGGTTTGRAFGSAGCRAYEADFEADAHRIWFPMIRMLGEVCASSDLLLQEGEYTTMLGWLDRYRVDGETLVLHTKRGEVLDFARVPTDATPTPLPPTPTPAASPVDLALGPRFQWESEDWSFIPTPSLQYVRRGGFPPNLEFEWRLLLDEEESTLPGQLTLRATTAPYFTVEEWLEVNDHEYGLVHRKAQREVHGRPAWQVDLDASGQGFLAGTQLVIQNGEDVLAFLVLTNTWDQYQLHADEIEAMFATIEFMHATPIPRPTPRFEGLGFVETTTRSPDGEWTATAVVATPNESNMGRYYRGLKVAQTRGPAVWQPLDSWEPFGFGYLSPRVVKWSNDGRYLYFTGVALADGCPPPTNGSDLQRLDLADGSVTEIIPDRARWLALSPDDRWLAYLTYQPIELVLHDMAAGEERRVAIASSPADTEAAPLVWSPDSGALVFTLAPWGCPPGGPRQRVVRLDLDSLAQTVLFEDDRVGYVATKWPEPHKLILGAPGVPPLEIDPSAKPGSATFGGKEALELELRGPALPEGRDGAAHRRTGATAVRWRTIGVLPAPITAVGDDDGIFRGFPQE
jgi:heat shock protein HslJ